MSNRYNQIKTTNSRYSPISTQEPVEIKFESPVYNPQLPKEDTTSLAPGPRIVQPRDKQETISQGTAQPIQKDSIWNKIARVALPKSAEEYFGLSQPGEPTGKERVKQAEDVKQSYFRSQRKEEITSQVDTPYEDYVAPDSFLGKLNEIKKYKGYGANVWSGFIKPAIGTISEQAGLTLDKPELRKWGEEFADRTLEEEKRRASAQSMADVPGPFEGGLKDPRFYSKAVSQAVGFMLSVFGTGIAVTAVTKNPAAGTAASFAFGAALEDSNAYQSMIEKGVNPDDANTAARIYGTIASVIENSTGIRPSAGMKGLTEDFAVGAAKNAGIKNFFKKWFEEGVLEEGSQQLVQNLVTKFVDKNQKTFDGVAESMISGLIGALPLTGGAALYTTNKEKADKYAKNVQPGLSIKDVSGKIPVTRLHEDINITTPAMIDSEVEKLFIERNGQDAFDEGVKEGAFGLEKIEQFGREYNEEFNEKYPELADESIIVYHDAIRGEDLAVISSGKVIEIYDNELQTRLEGETIDSVDGAIDTSKSVEGQPSLFTEPTTKETPVKPTEPIETPVEPPAPESPEETAEGIRAEGPEETPSLRQVVEEKKGNTPVAERVRWTDLWRTPWKVLDKLGLRDTYQVLLTSYENYVTELPGNIDKITAWSKRVSKKSNEKIFRFLDGEAIELTTEEAQVASEIKSWLAQWANRLKMKPDERISEYITHIFPIDSKGVEIPEEITSLIDKKVAKSVYNPFLLQRKGAEGYIKDTWKALDAYVKRGTRKVNMDPALKAFDEASRKLTDVSQQHYVEKYISRLNMRPTATDLQLDNEIKSRFGYFFGARPVNNITRFFRKMISRAKIGGSLTSFAKNLTQGVNTFAELGTIYTLRGYFGLFKSGSNKELAKENVLMGSFIEDRTYSAVKKAAEIADKVLFLNMEASENVNRGAAYFGAKAKFIAGKVKPIEFREALGIDMPAGYEPTLEDAIAYGKFVAGKTQFRFDPLETPMLLSSDLAKTAAQFQTFGLKQAEFILGMVNNKNKLKLARYLASSMLIFTYIGSAFGMSWDDSFKTLRFGMPPAVQFITDLYHGGILGEDRYGNKLDIGERAGMVGKSLFTNMVPAGAQLKRTFEGVQAVKEGVSRTKAGTFQYKIDQSPQNYIRGALFGKYSLPENREFYEKKEKKAKNKIKNKSGSSRYNSL